MLTFICVICQHRTQQDEMNVVSNGVKCVNNYNYRFAQNMLSVLFILTKCMCKKGCFLKIQHDILTCDILKVKRSSV